MFVCDVCLLSVFLDLGWSVKSNDRAYYQLPEFQRKVFLCIKKSKYSVRQCEVSCCRMGFNMIS